MRVEYQLGLTLASSFVVVSVAFLLKLAFLPNETPPPTNMNTDASGSAPPSTDAHVPTFHRPSMTEAEYKRLYKASLDDPETFWGHVAVSHLTWSKPFSTVFESGPAGPFDGFKWFSSGKLNACFNAVDRHAAANPHKVAIIWEPEDVESDQARHITYAELHRNVQKVAAYLQSIGVRKGDRVTIYMPSLPESIYAMLGCARMGAVHNVVFAGFGADSLRDRINDSGSRILIAANQGRRAGKLLDYKSIVDQALVGCPLVEQVVVLKRSGDHLTVMRQGRDVWWENAIDKAAGSSEVEEMSSEDPLFILYTSGSTGKPKALLHTTGGYLTYVAYTFKLLFDYSAAEDVYFSTADIGWITGHSYLVYGPLINNATMVVYEGAATHPGPSRLWQIINKYNASQFYTAPTLLRALRRLGDEHVLQCPSLKVLGSVGEPLDAKTWLWYYSVVGRGRCSMVDTYWQTETGGHLICTIPGAGPLVPGHAGLPFFGIDPDIVQAGEGTGSGALVVKRPWPGMARTVYGDHERYQKAYLSEHPGCYFTGDGASRDAHGNYMIHGRIDDVINVSAIRFATAEIEGALNRHPCCAESAVLGRPDELTGQSIVAFCLLKDECLAMDKDALANELRQLVRSSIGPIAHLKQVFFPLDLPKTRSGKIMRRVLRKILSSDPDLGDLSTLTNPAVIDEIRKLVG